MRLFTFGSSLNGWRVGGGGGETLIRVGVLISFLTKTCISAKALLIMNNINRKYTIHIIRTKAGIEQW